MTTADDLSKYLRHYESEYEVQYDAPILEIIKRNRGFLTPEDVSQIFTWKLQKHHSVAARKRLDEYVDKFPGLLEEKTALALSAETDLGAIEQLRGIPQMKGNSRVAVASCLLMCLDSTRFTVMDRRANESLVMLKPAILEISRSNNSFDLVQRNISKLNPPEGYYALAADFPEYLATCRELSLQTNLSLRSLDRALYSAKGNIALLGKLK